MNYKAITHGPWIKTKVGSYDFTNLDCSRREFLLASHTHRMAWSRACACWSCWADTTSDRIRSKGNVRPCQVNKFDWLRPSKSVEKIFEVQLNENYLNTLPTPNKYFTYTQHTQLKKRKSRIWGKKQFSFLAWHFIKFICDFLWSSIPIPFVLRMGHTWGVLGCE